MLNLQKSVDQLFGSGHCNYPSHSFERMHIGIYMCGRTFAMLCKSAWFPHFGLTNFPDFPNIFFQFSSIFSVLYLLNLRNTKIYLTNTLPLKSQRKNKNWLNFPHFSSILGKIPSFFQYFG